MSTFILVYIIFGLIYLIKHKDIVFDQFIFKVELFISILFVLFWLIIITFRAIFKVYYFIKNKRKNKIKEYKQL